MKFKKSGGRRCQESKIKRFQFIKANCREFRIVKLCEVLCVKRSSYYAWDKRPESTRAKENKKLLEQIRSIHKKSKNVFGSVKITKKLNEENITPIIIREWNT